MVADREFRSDLYYRLNVFPDPPAATTRASGRYSAAGESLYLQNCPSSRAQYRQHSCRDAAHLEQHGWPGNVRELENVIERAVLLTRGNVLQLSLPDIALPEPETPPAVTVVAREGEDEYQLIVRVLKETNGVVAGPKGAAQRLGLKRTTLLSRMKRLGIDKSALI